MTSHVTKANAVATRNCSEQCFGTSRPNQPSGRPCRIRIRICRGSASCLHRQLLMIVKRNRARVSDRAPCGRGARPNCPCTIATPAREGFPIRKYRSHLLPNMAEELSLPTMRQRAMSVRFPSARTSPSTLDLIPQSPGKGSWSFVLGLLFFGLFAPFEDQLGNAQGTGLHDVEEGL